MPFLKTPPWRNVWHLGLQDLTLPTPGAFACLLCALPALKRLIIEGPCTFSKHGFDLRHIPVNMPFPSRLDTLRFGDDFSLLSDLQSLHDLVDLFIQTGTTARLISLVAPLGPVLRFQTISNVFLNGLVKCAARSLSTIRLQAIPAYTAFGEDYCLGISTGTRGDHFIVVDFPEDDSLFAAAVELFRQALSAPLRQLRLTLKRLSAGHLARLLDSLPQVDAALSRKGFNELQTVLIKFRRLMSDVDIPVVKVRSYLPKLHARGILRIDRKSVV